MAAEIRECNSTRTPRRRECQHRQSWPAHFAAVSRPDLPLLACRRRRNVGQSWPPHHRYNAANGASIGRPRLLVGDALPTSAMLAGRVPGNKAFDGHSEGTMPMLPGDGAIVATTCHPNKGSHLPFQPAQHSVSDALGMTYMLQLSMDSMCSPRSIQQ